MSDDKQAAPAAPATPAAAAPAAGSSSSASSAPLDPKTKALNDYRKKLLEHREMEAKVKECKWPLSMQSSS